MSDLISRQALCEYALNQKDKSVTPNDIMRFPSAQQWIPCSERMPNKDGDYLVTYRWIGTYSNEAYLEIGIDEWRRGEWVERPTTYEVLAWMPLPEPHPKTDPTYERRNK